MASIVERAHREQQVAVEIVELDSRADASLRELAAKAAAYVQAARVARDRLRQRRDVGFDVRAVDADVDECLGGGLSREPGRDD